MTRVPFRAGGMLSALMFAACTAAPTAPPPTASPALSPPAPSPTAAPTPTATATAEPTPTVEPPPTAAPSPVSETLTWQDLGQIEPLGDERGLSLGFDGGYLAVTYADATVWYSPDGIAWQSTAFGGELPFCPGEGAGNVPEVSIEGMATDGR